MRNQFQFETETVILTSDNFALKLKGIFSYETNEPNNIEKKLQTTLDQTAINYFQNIPLMEALQYFELTNIEKFKNELSVNFQNMDVILDKFEITTVDAIENTTMDKIKYSIDPVLEGKKKKKRIFGRFRRK